MLRFFLCIASKAYVFKIVLYLSKKNRNIVSFFATGASNRCVCVCVCAYDTYDKILANPTVTNAAEAANIIKRILLPSSLPPTDKISDGVTLRLYHPTTA